ncbi:MAG TPA: hypothetical protein VFB51_15345 [Solirubrobacterales bacterium]|nr:hypothetical protein [Solirubrobacterales bacterium]
MAYRPRKNGDYAEQIHLPGPSLLPLFAAIGITVMLVGLILSWGFVIAGGVITLLTTWRWIKVAREEYEHLPRER